MGVGPHSRLLCGQCHARNCLPDLESFPHLSMIGGRGKPMPMGTKVLRNGTISREKTLSVAGGLEPLHAPLPLAGRLVRVLRAIIEIPMLPMFHPREEFSLGGTIALEFIGDDDPRYVR